MAIKLAHAIWYRGTILLRGGEETTQKTTDDRASTHISPQSDFLPFQTRRKYIRNEHETISRRRMDHSTLPIRRLFRFIKDANRFFTESAEIRTRLIPVQWRYERNDCWKFHIFPAESARYEQPETRSAGRRREVGRGSERCTFSLTVVALINQGETELDTRFREEKGERTWVIRWLVPPVFPPAIQFAGVSRPAALFLLDK